MSLILMQGFLEMINSSIVRDIISKRKYNLYTNSSIERPSWEDQHGAFKKLVKHSPAW